MIENIKFKKKKIFFNKIDCFKNLIILLKFNFIIIIKFIKIFIQLFLKNNFI